MSEGRRLQVYLFDRPESVTQEELRRDLAALPEWRRQKALFYRFDIDRVLCAKAWLLLKHGLKEMYGIDEDPEFEFNENGKPCLRNHPEIHFNLSHCRKGVMCVISDAPVGCDIEEIAGELDPDLCRYCFGEAGTADITASPDPCIAFTERWTRREALQKLLGAAADGSTADDADVDAAVIYDTVIDPEHSCVRTVCQYKAR